MAKTWYNMTPAKAEGGAAEILLYDTIGGWGVTAKQFAEDLKATAGAAITLRINSPGGDVMEGAAIFNILKADGRPVTVHVDGLAASMASVVAMAGQKVVMPANALMMIHNPWTLSMGDAERLRKDADLLDKIKTQIVGAYEGKCGGKKSRADIVAMMDAETWLDGKEAVEAGLADECGEAIKAAACAVDVAKFAAKVDARLSAIMPKAQVQDVVPPPAPPASVAPAVAATPASVLLDAAVVEARLDAERAAAYEDGYAARQDEVDGLKRQLAEINAVVSVLRQDLTNSQANISSLKVTVEKERKARDQAVKAHAALTGGLQLVPEGEGEEDFLKLQEKYGHAEARKRFPGSYAAFMAKHAPGTKQGK